MSSLSSVPGGQFGLVLESRDSVSALYVIPGPQPGLSLSERTTFQLLRSMRVTRSTSVLVTTASSSLVATAAACTTTTSRGTFWLRERPVMEVP
jgi:hypothetical protein